MSMGDTRAGVTQATENQESINLVILEVFVISAVAGWWYADWLVFGGALIGLFAMLAIPGVRWLLALALSVCWGLGGYLAGEALFSENAGYVLGGLLFLSGLGVHYGAMQWIGDMARNP